MHPMASPSTTTTHPAFTNHSACPDPPPHPYPLWESKEHGVCQSLASPSSSPFLHNIPPSPPYTTQPLPPARPHTTASHSACLINCLAPLLLLRFPKSSQCCSNTLQAAGKPVPSQQSPAQSPPRAMGPFCPLQRLGASQGGFVPGGYPAVAVCPPAGTRTGAAPCEKSKPKLIH